jgi:ClpP class serine protease
MHLDFSAANERMGVKPTYIYAGRYKVEGNPDEPLTDEARAAVQKSVNNVHRDFIRAVARNRGARPSDVILNYGQGRVLDTADALAAGMIDGVATLEQVVEMARSGASRRSSVQAVSAREHSDLKHRWHCKKLRAGTYFSQPAKTESDDDRRRRWRNTKRKAGV